MDALEKKLQPPAKMNHFDKVKVSMNSADCLLTTDSEVNTTTKPRLLDGVDESDTSSETSSSVSEWTGMEMLLSEPGPCIDWIDCLVSRLDSRSEDLLEMGSDSFLKIKLSDINTNDLVDILEERGFPLWQAVDLVRRCSTIEECIEMIRDRGWDQE